MTALRVDADTTLVAFLTVRLPAMKKGTLKDRLREGAVLINGQPQTKATYLVRVGDVVELSRAQATSKANSHGVTVLHDDADLVVIDKPSGLLSVGTDRGRDATALSVTARLVLGKEARLWPCHRLDQGTSGVLVMAKRKAVQEIVFSRWDEARKIYVAVVTGTMRDDEGEIDAALYENPQTLTVRVSTQPNAKPALTHYRVLRRGQGRTLVELHPHTGRKHQLRVHLLHLGHPIVGDDRYGDGSKRQRLCLHARALTLPHPTTNATLSLSAPVPSLFTQLI